MYRLFYLFVVCLNSLNQTQLPFSELIFCGIRETIAKFSEVITVCLRPILSISSYKATYPLKFAEESVDSHRKRALTNVKSFLKTVLLPLDEALSCDILVPKTRVDY